jgi:phosphopantetheine adenylyltransferase
MIIVTDGILVREISELGGDVSQFVPKGVSKALRQARKINV